MTKLLGKLAYGAIFCALLPAGLVWWARHTAAVVRLPVPEAPLLGAALAATGLLLMAGGMGSLWFRGGGLPMNAFPPVRLVASGLYGLVPHPIYVGASVLSVGAALLARSASGLWLVSPTLTLAWLALVYGYENAALRRRFPGRPAAGAGWALPANRRTCAPLAHRLRVALLVFGPWLLLYETVIYLGSSRQPISTLLAVEHTWPVWPWTEVFYALAYPFAVFAPLVLPTQRALRRFAISGWLATGIGGLLQLALPLVAAPRPFGATTLWGELLLWERAHDGITAAWPSFHVLWASVAAHAWDSRFSRLRPLFYLLAAAVALSCLTTGMHSLLDVLGGVALAALVLRYRAAWHGLRHGLERVANSWAAWQLGPLRVINHSLYAGLAMLVGVLLVGGLLPDARAVLPPVLLGVLGAGIWGQWVESASGLSRPFGYYGSLLGGLVGCAVSAVLTRFSFLDVLAACTLALPLVQGVGRARCLVQGCCHGRAAAGGVGIRVVHPKSRICALAHLAGQPVHATPAYSMLANLVVGLTLFRLAYEQVPAPVIIGVYLILSGLPRFVEEQYRGEPQTPAAAGLKLYQWLALATVLAGAATTAWPAPPWALSFAWQPATLPVALGAGLLAAFALGMDFPRSTKRFSRLAST